MCISKGIFVIDTYRMFPSGIYFQWKVAGVEDNDTVNWYNFTAFVLSQHVFSRISLAKREEWSASYDITSQAW